jgi:hypothetical protein
MPASEMHQGTKSRGVGLYAASGVDCLDDVLGHASAFHEGRRSAPQIMDAPGGHGWPAVPLADGGDRGVDP